MNILHLRIPTAAILVLLAGLSWHGLAAAGQPAHTDPLKLDPSSITGSKELPKVLNILPWKRATAGDSHELRDSLLDEVLAPVNRVEFRRELRYSGLLPATQSPP